MAYSNSLMQWYNICDLFFVLSFQSLNSPYDRFLLFLSFTIFLSVIVGNISQRLCCWWERPISIQTHDSIRCPPSPQYYQWVSPLSFLHSTISLFRRQSWCLKISWKINYSDTLMLNEDAVWFCYTERKHVYSSICDIWPVIMLANLVWTFSIWRFNNSMCKWRHREITIPYHFLKLITYSVIKGIQVPLHSLLFTVDAIYPMYFGHDRIAEHVSQ